MISRLQIEVLGELTVKREGQPQPLPRSKKTRALLAYLAVVGRPQRREHLCRMFWENPDDPRASLRWSLHKIKQIANAGGQEWLEANHDSVFLLPQTIELDLAKVASLRPDELDRRDTGTLELLATIFRGDFLEDLSLPRCPKFEAWRIYQRDAALRLRFEILHRLVSRFGGTSDRALYYSSTLKSLDCEDAGADRASPEVLLEHASPVLHGSKENLQGKLLKSARLSESPIVSDTPVRSQEIRFCGTADGVRVAYAVCGRGPTIVRAAHWMSHLQYDWESPVWRHWINALSEEMTLIRYDERGNGLSDWDVADVSFPAMVADLESVVDAAAPNRFTLLGVSQSCAVSVAYAVRNPERVSGLILYGGFVKGWRKRGDPHGAATHEAMTTLIREGWGQNNPVFRRLFTMMFIPGASQDQMDWFDQLQRITVSSENACRLHEAFGDIDVSNLLSKVRVPTLVLHARQDAAVPFQAGREFATGVPGARFVDLDSKNHILLRDEQGFAQFVDEVRRFVAETAQA